MTPAELAEIFDEQDSRGALSASSQVALTYLYEQIESDPIRSGCLVCRVERWQIIRMARAGERGPGMYAVYGWQVADDRGRMRILVTLHVDEGAFEAVAGLFYTEEDAATSLSRFGNFEWRW